MKRFLPALLAALLVWTAPAASVEVKAPTFTTGRDWAERMSQTEKFMAIVAPMMFFRHAGVPFRLRPEEYIPQVERVIENNPYLESEDVSNIFASTVYALEPESRLRFNRLAEAVAEGRMYLKEGFCPKLLIAPPDREIRPDAIS